MDTLLRFMAHISGVGHICWTHILRLGPRETAMKENA